MDLKYSIFGLQRSGTNLLEKYMWMNYGWLCSTMYQSPKILHPGIWKHAFDFQHDIDTKHAKREIDGQVRLLDIDYLNSLLAETNAILITKHPYMWVESILRTPMDVRLFKAYNGTVKSLCKVYNDHARFWIDTIETHDNKIHVRYEDLLEDPEACSQRFQNFFNLERTEKYDSRLPKAVPLSPTKFTDHRKQEYINIHHRLKPIDFNTVNDCIDPEIMKYYGYQLRN